MPSAEECDPCPGCGELIPYRFRAGRRRRPWLTQRQKHCCPHLRPCIGNSAEGLTWQCGDWWHWRACPECCETARMREHIPPSVFDCRDCGAPLPFDPGVYRDACPKTPRGAVFVFGIPCMKCSSTWSYWFAKGEAGRLDARGLLTEPAAVVGGPADPAGN